MPPFLLPPLILGISLLCHEIARRIFPKIGLVDFPKRYGLIRQPIPYPSGIVSVVLFLVFFLLHSESSLQQLGLIVAIVLLATFSFIDDRRPLPSLLRAGIHLLVTLIIFVTGSRIYTLTNPLAGSLQIGHHLIVADILKLDSVNLLLPYFGPVPILSGIFTIVWLGLTINALNWFDGISGQVSLLSVIGFLTIGFLSMSDRVQQPELALISFVLAAIAGGSFVFDFPPPRMLIGDTGAMFFGLMLGVLTIYSGGKVATTFLVLGVPLIDSVMVVFRRLRKGKSILQGNASDEHLHHRLLAKGWSPRQVLLLTAALGTAFGVTALFLNTWTKFLAGIVLLLVMLLLSEYSKPCVRAEGKDGRKAEGKDGRKAEGKDGRKAEGNPLS